MGGIVSTARSGRFEIVREVADDIRHQRDRGPHRPAAEDSRNWTSVPPFQPSEPSRKRITLLLPDAESCRMLVWDGGTIAEDVDRAFTENQPARGTT